MRLRTGNVREAVPASCFQGFSCPAPHRTGLLVLRGRAPPFPLLRVTAFAAGLHAAPTNLCLPTSSEFSDCRHRDLQHSLSITRTEPLGVDRETSTLLAKVFTTLWSKGLTKRDIANDINLPWEEIESLVFGLTGSSLVRPTEGNLSVVSQKR